jgi:glycosyltransferase involved in cell wall biosynthesis
MRRQALNTLYSLSAVYQRNINLDDYEVIVVENASDENLDPNEIAALDGNFNYFLRNETEVSPAPAINFALEQCRGEILGLIIDGARMLTPQVLAHTLSVRKMFESPLIVVPGYHLGEQWQENMDGNQAKKEQGMLESIQWKTDGYSLFKHACFSPGNRNGYFHPLMECTALFCNRVSFSNIGGADENFAFAGGGSLNLHIYRSLGVQHKNTLVILPGEGNFHQYHGGVTTRAFTEREELLRVFNDQLNSYWDGQYKALRREPILFGAIGAAAQKFLESSCEAGVRRFARLTVQGFAPWPDDQLEANCEDLRPC